MLLSLLSKQYPFFHPPNDLHALAEIIQVFGSGICVDAAKELGISLILSEDSPGIGLDSFCISNCELMYADLHKELTALLKNILTVNPLNRLTAAQCVCCKLFQN